MQNRVLLSILVACGLFAVAGPAAAWGREGHEIIAAIAEAHLTPTARERVIQLLHAVEPDASMESVAPWADTVRTRVTAKWHFVNYPAGHCHFDPPRDCRNGECLVAAFDRERAILADPRLPVAEREVALKYVIHFAGDATQPLHNYGPGRGANAYQVQFEGRGTNLHHVWDTDLIRQYAMEGQGISGWSHPNYRALTRTLIADSFQVTYTPSLNPIDWTESACAIANRPGMFPARVIPQSYVARWEPVVDAQLIEGGLNLAAVLNEIFGETRG